VNALSARARARTGLYRKANFLCHVCRESFAQCDAEDDPPPCSPKCAFRLAVREAIEEHSARLSSQVMLEICEAEVAS
jgi:hypothetical protein